MPPKPSSASNDNNKTKEQSGKKKASSRPRSDYRDREEEEEKKKKKELVDELLVTELGRSMGITGERIASEANARALAGPDRPPCDGCSKPSSGTMQCGKCESVFYCGRECQVAHWSAGHKAECRQLKKCNKETAKRVLRQFNDIRAWSDLDVAGAYKAAVHQGLHDKIRGVLEQDKAEVVDRYQGRHHVVVSYAHCVMAMLFRGQRGESEFGRVDGLRVRGYARSHPGALDAWLQASVQVTRAVADPATLRDVHLHLAAALAARDVWNMWTMAFTCPTAARAILTPLPPPTKGTTDDDGNGDGDGNGGGGDEERSAVQRRERGEDHARRIVQALVEAIRLAGSVPDDPRADLSVVKEMKCNVHEVAALVVARTQEYGIGIDVERMLNLTGEMEELFQGLLLPKARRTVEGRKLTPQEANAILARFCGGPPNQGN